MPTPPEQLEAEGALAGLIASIGRVLLGKEHQVRLAVAGLLARGHLLLEDLPGTGKTTLAEALARGFGLAFKRVSFTSDLLPADLTGINVLDPGSGTFRFQSGPLFTQVLLADEINRASPRTQSALLEAMAAGRVSIDGTSHDLSRPFVVIATQNGLDQIGTAPLPESQLDRFLMRLSLGFPERAAERALLAGEALRLDAFLDAQAPVSLPALQQRCSRQHCSPALLDYVLDLVALSRRADQPGAPLSPRASQGLVAAARAWSLLEGRPFVTPADVQAVFPSVAEHRLEPSSAGGLSERLMEQVDALR
ncbi:MoxR protein [Cyanobium sp. PCC 7001]|uniref:AAA family ATPase n=1 Tax=Cyanobium sp. PCC 7001 TaxID=180281 RepID=UPI00018056F3|nr:MoxR family ATPase [Cyanobium sp. PCC 7001]EDY38695.1 MoxR protein [Cyanobium sp. PCC 7001]